MFGQEAHFTPYAKDRYPYAIERYSREVDRLLMVMDGRLARAQWLAGDEYTIADMATLPYLRRQLIEMAVRYQHVERWAAAMPMRRGVVEGMKVGVTRPEVIEGGLQGFTDEHRAILWGDRQHAPRS